MIQRVIIARTDRKVYGPFLQDGDSLLFISRGGVLQIWGQRKKANSDIFEQ